MEVIACEGTAASSLASWITMWKGAEVSGHQLLEGAILEMDPLAPLRSLDFSVPAHI